LTPAESVAALESAHLMPNEDGVLKYVAVYKRVVSMIKSGAWKPGEQLPPELDLARMMQVSLGTAQRALRMLSDDGVVVRRQGHGTFVAGAPTTTNASEIRNYRFLAGDGTSLLPIYTRVIDIKESTETGGWSQFFRDEESFVSIVRLVNVNMEFQNYSRLFLPISRFRPLLKFGLHDLDGAVLTHYLGEHFNIPVLRMVHHLRTIELPEPICTAVDVSKNTIGTEWEMFGYTTKNTPISYQHVYMPPHKRTLELRDSPA